MKGTMMYQIRHKPYNASYHVYPCFYNLTYSLTHSKDTIAFKNYISQITFEKQNLTDSFDSFLIFKKVYLRKYMSVIF